MRDIIVLALIFGSLPFCLFKPWIGILVWSWIGYMNPHKFAYGIAQNFPVAQYVGIITLVGFIFTRDKHRFPFVKEIFLIIVLWILFTISTSQAFYPNNAWDQWEKVSKILLMTLVMIPLFIDEKKFKYLLYVVVGTFALLALKGTIFSILTGGQFHVYGPPGSFIEDNNEFAMALNMVLPMMFFLAKNENNKVVKRLLTFAFFFSIISVVFTYSRGGFVGLAVVTLLIFLKTRNKVIASFCFVTCIFIFTMFLPQKYIGRIRTIQTYEQDASAMGRINAWYFALNLAKDRPLVGGGFEAFTPELFERYAPEPEVVHDAHSIYFEILGEHGYVALILYLLLILSSLTTIRKIKKTSREYDRFQQFYNYADMFQISIIAFMVNGAFLGRAYFDLFYQITAMIVMLKVITIEKYNEYDNYRRMNNIESSFTKRQPLLEPVLITK